MFKIFPLKRLYKKLLFLKRNNQSQFLPKMKQSQAKVMAVFVSKIDSTVYLRTNKRKQP